MLNNGLPPLPGLVPCNFLPGAARRKNRSEAAASPLAPGYSLRPLQGRVLAAWATGKMRFAAETDFRPDYTESK